MAVSYSPFLTPFASPSLGRIDMSGIEDAAKAFEQRAQYDQTRQDRLAKEAQDYQLNKQHRDAEDQYYAQQAETHRMQVEQMKNADFEKRSNALFDAFRKAKTPTDRKAVMDELSRLGYKVEEQASDLPPPAPPPMSAETAPAAPPKPAKGAKTPKPNKQFMAALGQIVTDENAQETPVDESQLGKGTLASVLGVPGADAASGEASGASAAGEIPAPIAPQPGGKFVIKDKNGIVVHSYDEPLERARTQVLVNSAMGGLKDAARTERERSAADAAVKMAAGLVDSGTSVADAAKLGLDAYGRSLTGEFKKVYPGSGGSGGTGGLPSKTALKIEGMDREQTDKIIRRVDKDGDAKKQIDGINFARRAMASLDSGSGMGDLDAFKSYLLQMSGKVVTDKEMDQFMHSEGAWAGWEKKLNEYNVSNPGRFPPEFVAPLRAMFQRFIELNSANLKQMADNARSQAQLSGLGENDQAIVYGHFTGEFPGGGKGAGKQEDTRSDEDLVKAWKKGQK